MIASRPSLGLLCAALLPLGVTAGDATALFEQNCAPCHGKDGKAKTPMARKLGVKDLTQSKTTDEQIERQIREGTKTPDGKAQMPSFGDRLSAEQVKLLIRFVRELRK